MTIVGEGGLSTNHAPAAIVETVKIAMKLFSKSRKTPLERDTDPEREGTRISGIGVGSCSEKSACGGAGIGEAGDCEIEEVS